MSQKEDYVKNESVGQLYGLFGLNRDETQLAINGKDIEMSEELAQNCEQTIESNVEIAVNGKECCICKSTSPQYCCPNCRLKTCSLNCCQTHKQRFNCNGIRNKLSFIKMTDFSQNEFISDYLFLEDTERTIDNNARQRRAIISSKPILPKWIQKLIRESRLRGIRLQIMPAGFQKRRQNTTCFMYNQKLILWDIECHFPQALEADHKKFDPLIGDDLVESHSQFKLINRRMSENMKLSELVSQYVEPKQLIENYELNRKLTLYRNSGVEGISVLFKLEFQPFKHQKYIELDLNKTIKDNLFGKTIVEFPTFVIILNKLKHLFDINSEKPQIKTSSEEK